MEKHDFEINVTLQLMATLSKCCNANAENLINTLTFDQRSNESGSFVNFPQN